MKSIIFIISIIAFTAISATALDDNAAKQGISLAFQLGQEYNEVSKHQGSPTNYNALVDQWNVYVQANFADASMLMQKMDEKTANLQKPYVLGKNTTNNGIVHSIDGSNKWGASYTTNDMNLLPESARNQVLGATYDASGNFLGYTKAGEDGYLGGV